MYAFENVNVPIGAPRLAKAVGVRYTEMPERR